MSSKSIQYFQELLAKETEKYRNLVSGFYNTVVRLKNEAKDARTNVPEMALALYACHDRYETVKATDPENLEIKGRSKAQYVHGFLGISADKKPSLWNHVESVANAIRYVTHGDITESDFRDVTADGRYAAMTLASEILTKACDDFSHAAVQEAAGLLKRRPSNLTTALKDIKSRFVEVDSDETKGKKTVFLSQQEMAEKEKTAVMLQQTQWLDDLVKRCGTRPLFAALAAEAQSTENPDVAKALVKGLVSVQVALTANENEQRGRRWSKETLQGWNAEFAPMVAVTDESVRAEYAALYARLSEMESKYADVLNLDKAVPSSDAVAA